MPKITKRAVDALLPAERERVVWDDDIKGFGVRVHPTGRKVYIVKYRHEGRSVKVTIGPHGPVTPAAARARAAEIVTLAKTGRDVAGKTPHARGSTTMAALARRFMDEYAPAHLKPSTARLYRKIIENRILPRFGKRRVSDIGKSDVVALHHDMRDVPDHANRTLSVLSRMLTLAEVWEMRPEGVNPCRYVKKYPEHKRERFLSDEEYRRLGSALRDAEREGFAPPAAIAAIRLLMLTGCRSGEIMSLRWDYVDLEMGELRLPDSKTGSKVVHLGDPAIVVLRGISRKEGIPWVFAGTKPGRHITYLHDAWRRILERAGIENLRIHDLRHSYASGGLLVGEGLPMIGKLLGHNKVQTTARYAHLANDPVKSAANRIATRIAEVAG
ncbi:MAG: site-specific integrase [Deltaproteobacteria bacterium]|nr:site-specific integrase [Deltaproteobacteria bacterium]